MSIVGTAWLDGQELSTDGALVGAFIEETCIGFASPMMYESTGRYLFFMVVFGNSEHIEIPIRFELYQSGDPVVVQGDLLRFEVDATIGNVKEPFIIAEPKLAEGTDILSFSLGDNSLDVQITDNEVNVILDMSSTTSNLHITFELSEGAVLWVEDQQWISGESILNYISPLTLRVFSEGLFHHKEYRLTLSHEHDILIANNFISPNGDGYNDFWVISNPDRYAEYEIKVRSQGGEVVFERTGYETPWDGIYQGKLLPVGTYWYVITNPNTRQKFRGFITLIY
jgi:gliding motility-associated-like protein